MESVILLWAAAALYVGQAGFSAYNGNWPYVVIMAAYAVANVGLIWSMKT